VGKSLVKRYALQFWVDSQVTDIVSGEDESLTSLSLWFSTTFLIVIFKSLFCHDVRVALIYS
jgi:hypothetical protein